MCVFYIVMMRCEPKKGNKGKCVFTPKKVNSLKSVINNIYNNKHTYITIFLNIIIYLII
jgi:hypothetical protein